MGQTNSDVKKKNLNKEIIFSITKDIYNHKLIYEQEILEIKIKNQNLPAVNLLQVKRRREKKYKSFAIYLFQNKVLTSPYGRKCLNCIP